MESLKINTSQLINIEHGLTLLHSDMMDRLNGVHPSDPIRETLKPYYKEKITEISEQIKECRKLITGQK